MKSRLVLWIMVFIIIGNCISINIVEAKDGEGKSEALGLVESIPKDSSIDVALDTQIKLLFNKNVVNLSVKDNNSQCFFLLDANKQRFPVDIIFADDQMEPDKKREIILKPRERLKENTTYTVEISPKLQAKNGTSLDKTVTVTFTTIALLTKEAAKKPAIETPAKSQTISSQPAKLVTAVKEPSSEKETTPVYPSSEAVLEAVSDEISGNVKSDINLNDNINQIKSNAEPKFHLASYSWVIIIVAITAFLFILSIKAKKRKS